MWFERFGYEQNPFDLNPFEAEYTFINHTDLIETVIYLVKSGSIFAIEGAPGTGKSVLMRQVIEYFEGNNKITYLDGREYEKEIDIERIINAKGTWTSLFKRKPSSMILLLDNVESLSIKNCEKIKYYFDQNYLLSVIFTTENYKKLTISDSLKNRIAQQLIRVPKINKYDALRIVRNRFTDHFFLPDEAIMKIFSFSHHNIKETLENCDTVCKIVSDEGRGEVLLKYVQAILGPKKKTSLKAVLSKKTIKDNLEIIRAQT